MVSIPSTKGQSQLEQSHPKCGTSDCVIISSCPALLKLVFQVKSGDQAAKNKLFANQCGFEKALPKVCCDRNGENTEKARISVNTQTVKPKSISAALVHTAKQSLKLKRTRTFPINRLIKKDRVEIPSDCGQGNAGSNRIVYGKVAKKNAWPWIAALGYADPNTGKVIYRCGASLVTSKHVVTAAHCITDDLVTVLLGEHVIGDDTDGANPEEFRIVKITKHENFKYGTFENDIAIVEMETEVTFKKGIQPVCLPSKTPKLLQDKFVSEGVYVAGWGRTSWRGPKSTILLEGIINVVSNQECKAKFALFDDVDIVDTKLCAKDIYDNSGACLGDSGGPLVTLRRADDNRYRYHLIGVVSSGYTKCHALRGFPDVYTRVTEFDQWIRDTVNK